MQIHALPTFLYHCLLRLIHIRNVAFSAGSKFYSKSVEINPEIIIGSNCSSSQLRVETCRPKFSLLGFLGKESKMTDFLVSYKLPSFQ